MIHSTMTARLCNRIERNDPSLTILIIPGDDKDILHILRSVKNKNATITKLLIRNNSMHTFPIDSVLALSATISGHCSIRSLVLWHVALTDLTPIITAIIQNDHLTRLTLKDCTVTSQVLERLLYSDALETLVVDGYVGHEPTLVLDLSLDALSKAKSLKKLQVESITLSSETVIAITELLQSGQGVQVLGLTNVNLTSRTVQCIAEAATGHPSLRRLRMEQCEQRGGLDEDAAQAIGNMIGNTPGMRVLSVDKCSIGPVAACHIFEGLKSTQCGLEKLIVSNNKIGTVGGLELATALRTNESIKWIDLQKNGIIDSPAAAQVLAEVQYLLALNRGGRRLLKASPGIPPSVWPYVLARSANIPDVLFHFLYEKPDIIAPDALGTSANGRIEAYRGS